MLGKMGLIVGCCGTGGLGLEKYLNLLTSMEVQDTFYRKVKTSTLRKWREKAGEDFVFTIKAFQGITHPASSPTWKRSNWKPDPPQRYGLLRPTKENLDLWEDVLEWADVIKAKAILVQLPPSFNNTDENRRNVFEFFSRREKFEIAIEFRHRSWFNEEMGEWMDKKGFPKDWNRVLVSGKILTGIGFMSRAYRDIEKLGDGIISEESAKFFDKVK